MDDFKKLYDVLVSEGKFTKSYDEFQSLWLEDEEYKNKVYEVVKEDGLFTKEKDSFLEKYSLTPQKKSNRRGRTFGIVLGRSFYGYYRGDWCWGLFY